MLAMGRALMSHPKLLMLDEPSMGLAPILVDQIFDIIQELHDAGTTILLVEQNASKALQIADRAYVLETGAITLSGTGAELAVSDEVRKAYLGGVVEYERTNRVCGRLVEAGGGMLAKGKNGRREKV